jgi:hypothetical protein
MREIYPFIWIKVWRINNVRKTEANELVSTFSEIISATYTQIKRGVNILEIN